MSHGKCVETFWNMISIVPRRRRGGKCLWFHFIIFSFYLLFLPLLAFPGSSASSGGVGAFTFIFLCSLFSFFLSLVFSFFFPSLLWFHYWLFLLLRFPFISFSFPLLFLLFLCRGLCRGGARLLPALGSHCGGFGYGVFFSSVSIPPSRLKSWNFTFAFKFAFEPYACKRKARNSMNHHNISACHISLNIKSE